MADFVRAAGHRWTLQSTESTVRQTMGGWVSEHDSDMHSVQWLAQCGKSLFDGHQGYRLGDMLYSRYFRHAHGGGFFHLKHWPESFAAIYLTQYHDKRRDLSPAMSIADIIRRRRPRLQLQKVAGIHLRVGDVIELAEWQSNDVLLCRGGGAYLQWKDPGGRSEEVVCTGLKK